MAHRVTLSVFLLALLLALGNAPASRGRTVGFQEVQDAPRLPLRLRDGTPPSPAALPARAPVSVYAQGLDPEILRAVQRWARYYQVDIGFALCVAYHESRFDRFAVGDEGAAFGLYQFWLPTWRMLRQQMGLSTQDRRFHVEESVKTALWAFAHGYRSHWAAVKKGLCP